MEIDFHWLAHQQPVSKRCNLEDAPRNGNPVFLKHDCKL